MKKQSDADDKKKLQKEKKKESTFDNALNTDPVFMKSHLEDTKRTYRDNLFYLEQIRDGKVKDCQFDPKSGDIIEKPISMDVRVKAISQINAMTLHKVMADKRDPGNAKDKGKGIDHEESLKRVAAEMAREKEAKKKALEAAAVKDGKLLKLKSGAE